MDDDALAPDRLDALDGALTTCAAGCAETGTIALDGGPGQGRRALSLVPDLHVCVIRADDIVETVPELIAALEPSARAGRPIIARLRARRRRATSSSTASRVCTGRGGWSSSSRRKSVRFDV